MPLFEYHCRACDKTFEKLYKQQTDTAACPDCGKDAPKVVSAFAHGSCAAPSGSGFG